MDHWDDHILSPTTTSDRIDNIIKRYENYPSIMNIKIKYNSVPSFLFHPVSTNYVKKVIQNLKNNKSVGGEIFDALTNCINKSIRTGCFQGSFKNANTTPVFKRDDRLDKSNYSPVSILPLISKVYERLIYNQLISPSEVFLKVQSCKLKKH